MRPQFRAIMVLMDIVFQVGAVMGPIMLLALVVLPSFISVLRQRGVVMGAISLIMVGSVVVGLEAASVESGLPYGRFTYDEAIIGKFLGTIPWFIPMAFGFVIFAAFWFGSFWTKSYARISLAVLFTLAASVTIEPILSILGIRQWQSPGPFFGVPVLAFVGWFLTATLASGLLHLMWSDRPVHRGAAYSGFFILLFFTGINMGTGLWIPAGVGGVLGLLILILFVTEKGKKRHESSTI